MLQPPELPGQKDPFVGSNLTHKDYMSITVFIPGGRCEPTLNQSRLGVDEGENKNTHEETVHYIHHSQLMKS